MSDPRQAPGQRQYDGQPQYQGEPQPAQFQGQTPYSGPPPSPGAPQYQGGPQYGMPPQAQQPYVGQPPYQGQPQYMAQGQPQLPAQPGYPAQFQATIQPTMEVNMPLGTGSEQCPHCMTWNYPGATTCRMCHASKIDVQSYRPWVVLLWIGATIVAPLWFFLNNLRPGAGIFVAIIGAGVVAIVVFVIGLIVAQKTARSSTGWVKRTGY